MYFPFHTENPSNLPPPGSWYTEQQHSSEETTAASDEGEQGEGQGEEENEVSLQIALTIVNELAELSAWLQRQSSALEASSHITFDPEGRPVFDFSIPLESTGGQVGRPAVPVVPPSYSRATATGVNLPSLNTQQGQPADYRSILNGYSSDVTTWFPGQYGTPPPSYSRATSQQYFSPEHPPVPPTGPGLCAIARTPPPSYGRAIRDNRERPSIVPLETLLGSDNTSNGYHVSNISVG